MWSKLESPAVCLLSALLNVKGVLPNIWHFNFISTIIYLQNVFVPHIMKYDYDTYDTLIIIIEVVQIFKKCIHFQNNVTMGYVFAFVDKNTLKLCECL